MLRNSILLVLIFNCFFPTSQVISIEFRDVHKHSYHLLDSVNLNNQEIYDVQSEYIFDIQKNTMTTEFKNQPEFNAETTVEVDCSNGIYQFSFNDTDMETGTISYKTNLTVDVNTNKVLYSEHMPDFQVINNFSFIDFTMGLAQ